MFRIVATAAGVSDFDAKLLMNHSIPGVNAGYITWHKLLEDHLRRQQQTVSTAVFAALGTPPAENRVLPASFGREVAGRAISGSDVKGLESDARAYFCSRSGVAMSAMMRQSMALFGTSQKRNTKRTLCAMQEYARQAIGAAPGLGTVAQMAMHPSSPLIAQIRSRR